MKDNIKSFFNFINTLRITIIVVPTIATILGVLLNNLFFFGFGAGFLIAALMIAIVTFIYG